MGRGPYTEGDFDRLMLYPLAIGIILFGYGGWNTFQELRKFHEWSPGWIKLTLVGLGLIIFGIVLLWAINRRN